MQFHVKYLICDVWWSTCKQPWTECCRTLAGKHCWRIKQRQVRVTWYT